MINNIEPGTLVTFSDFKVPGCRTTTLTPNPGNDSVIGNESCGVFHRGDVAIVLALGESNLGKELYILTNQSQLGWALRDMTRSL